jgi:tetratricopeptide (TPR) repeat protein
MFEVDQIAAATLIHDRYEVLRQIGRGGMGAVYEAIDRRLGHRVALKQTLVSGFSEEAAPLRRAFEREARILAGLRHPALPVVSDYFQDDTAQYLVMQYIPGDDLAELQLQRGAPFDVALVLAWADTLLDLLEYLHTQDLPVLHRDIKPQNLKLTPRGEIVLLDFGLARGSHSPRSRATTSGSLIAYTPQYAPLEQIRGLEIDARSDLYALAATLHHLLTGELPASAFDRAAAALEQRPDPLRPVHELNPLVPAPVSMLLLEALSPRVEARPESAAAMRESLRAARAAGGETIEARTLALGRTYSSPKRTIAVPRAALAEEPAQSGFWQQIGMVHVIGAATTTLILLLLVVYSMATGARAAGGSYEDLLARAAAEASGGDDAAAIATLSQAIASEPDRPEAHIERGDLLARSGNLEAALADLELAIQAAPDHAPAYHLRGMLYARSGNLELASADYERAVAIDAGYADPHLSLGLLAFSQHEYARAIASFDSYLALRPEGASGLFHRAQAHYFASDYAAAIDDFTRYLAQRPDDAEAYLGRGRAYAASGDDRRALDDYDRAIVLRPDLAEAHYERGLTHERSGRADAALADYRRALDLTSDSDLRLRVEARVRAVQD